ncbi:MAG: DUF1919 domain-containing protein [Lachnospiraceae bacterium]|nr:DUF1919 domain-containing protein [Lachnospiraceae bacterium]
MDSKHKILLWGIGQEYNRVINALKYWEDQNAIEIVGVTDKNIPDLEEIDGWKVYKTIEIHELNIDYYLVMSEKYFLEISKELLVLGVNKNKILNSKILGIPYFSWEKYLLVQKGDLSIICNNCVGGIIYNTLGMECLSPCKNLSIPDESFLKLTQNLEKYMSLELEFKRWQRDPHSQKDFPVMKLDDIEIWCNHDESISEAQDKWDRRKKKINFKNIMLIMYTETEETGRRFLDIEQYKKVLFVSEKSTLEGKDVYRLKMFPGQKEFWETVNNSATLGKSSCNYRILDMLVGKKVYRNRDRKASI